MALMYSFASLLAACFLCNAMQEIAPPVNPISPPLTPDNNTENNSAAATTGTKQGGEANGCSCETKSEDGDTFSIIDYIFGGDDDYDEDYDRKLISSDLQRASNTGSSSDEDQLLYKRKKRKNKNKKRYELRRRPGQKFKKNSKGDYGTLVISHRGHKRLKPELPCYPEKLSTCFKVNESAVALNCDREKDFCVDDCDCPGFQKCCVNSCGHRECLPSFYLPGQSPITTESPAPPSAGSENSGQPEIKPVDNHETKITESIGETTPASVRKLGQPVVTVSIQPPVPAARFLRVKK